MLWQFPRGPVQMLAEIGKIQLWVFFSRRWTGPPSPVSRSATCHRPYAGTHHLSSSARTPTPRGSSPRWTFSRTDLLPTAQAPGQGFSGSTLTRGTDNGWGHPVHSGLLSIHLGLCPL